MPAQEDHGVPECLYRYRSLAARGGASKTKIRAREIDAILEGYLWAGSFDALNDPMEGRFSTPFLREVRKAVRSGRSQLGISSFSESPSHELMWAHYADEFRGICIRYRYDELVDGLPDGLMSRVVYEDRLPKITDAANPIERAQEVLSTKGARWAYEREWRYLGLQIGRVAYVQKPSKPVIDRVYLGFRTSDRDRSALCKAIEGTKITVMEMTLMGNRVNFQKLSSS